MSDGGRRGLSFQQDQHDREEDASEVQGDQEGEDRRHHKNAIRGLQQNVRPGKDRWSSRSHKLNSIFIFYFLHNYFVILV